MLWATWRASNVRLGLSSSLQAAKNLVELPYWPGYAMVRNERTGETWERRGGSWFKTQDHWPQKARA